MGENPAISCACLGESSCCSVLLLVQFLYMLAYNREIIHNYWHVLEQLVASKASAYKEGVSISNPAFCTLSYIRAALR
jgi:hypothetical protein